MSTVPIKFMTCYNTDTDTAQESENDQENQVGAAPVKRSLKKKLCLLVASSIPIPGGLFLRDYHKAGDPHGTGAFTAA